jgi:hypothetical protein
MERHEVDVHPRQGARQPPQVRRGRGRRAGLQIAIGEPPDVPGGHPDRIRTGARHAAPRQDDGLAPLRRGPDLRGVTRRVDRRWIHGRGHRGQDLADVACHDPVDTAPEHARSAIPEMGGPDRLTGMGCRRPGSERAGSRGGPDDKRPE